MMLDRVNWISIWTEWLKIINKPKEEREREREKRNGVGLFLFKLISIDNK